MALFLRMAGLFSKGFIWDNGSGRYRRAVGRLSIWICALLLLNTCPSFATNNVSRPVGFVRISVASGHDELSAIPLDAFDNRLAAIMGTQLAGGTNVTDSDNILKWSAYDQAYLQFWKDTSGTWYQVPETVETTNTLSPGEAFWIVNRRNYTQDVFLAGRVVLQSTGAVEFAEAMNIFSYPFTSKIQLNDANMAVNGALSGADALSSDVITETVGNQYFWLTNASPSSLWLDENNVLANEDLLMGRGYWYDRATSNSYMWTETRPYADVFPNNEDPPAITSVTFNASGDEATLYIDTWGSVSEVVEIFYQDVSQTNAFKATNGWLVAETDLETLGAQSVVWTDAGSSGRGKVDTVFARFYLAAFGQIDDDSDGLPNGRELFIYGSDPANEDSDGDGMPDGWEASSGLNPLVGGEDFEDLDGDGYANIFEFLGGGDAQDSTSAGVAEKILAAGDKHSLYAREINKAFAWGGNADGQLGLGETGGKTSLPARIHGYQNVGFMTNLINVSACKSHSAAVDGQGVVWTWGKNGAEGQLGNDSAANTNSPVRPLSFDASGYLSNAVTVVVGERHTLTLLGDGRISAWGDNKETQLGISSNGTYYRFPHIVAGPGSEVALTNMISVAAGYKHSLALRRDGSVYSWGKNGNGMLGLGTSGGKSNRPTRVLDSSGTQYLSNIVVIAAGKDHSLALDSSGHVWAWGKNGKEGRLGDDTENNSYLPVQVIETNGGVHAFGDVVDIAAGESHNLALKSDGTLWAWGKNKEGRLGDNSTTHRKTPVRVHGVDDIGFLEGVTTIAAGKSHSLALGGQCTLYAWGKNKDYQLGDGSGVNRFTPVVVDGDSVHPVLTVPSNTLVECGGSTEPAVTGSATATDDRDPEPTVSYEDALVSGSCAQAYDIHRIWSAVDGCGNVSVATQIVSVVDSTSPIISCPADVDLQCDESSLPANTGEAAAIDLCDAAPQISFSDSIAFGACTNEYVITRTWEAVDACNNLTNCVQTISVTDTSSPVLSSTPADEFVLCIIPDPEVVTATDNCTTNVLVALTQFTNGVNPAVITRVWTATDSCGNSVVHTQLVTVAPCVSDIFGSVTYFGSQTGVVRVVASTDAIVWTTNVETSISNPGSYQLSDVENYTNYWVRAYRDVNGNHMWDSWEAVGEYPLNPLYLTSDVFGVDILLLESGADAVVTADDLAFSTNRLAIGESVAVTAVVHNAGTDDMTNVTVRFYANDIAITLDQTIPLLASGSSEEVVMSTSFPSNGYQVIRVSVDPDNVLPETSELNNDATRVLVVGVPGVAARIRVSGSFSHNPACPGTLVVLSGSAVYEIPIGSITNTYPVEGATLTIQHESGEVIFSDYTDSAGTFAPKLGVPAVEGFYRLYVFVDDETLIGQEEIGLYSSAEACVLPEDYIELGARACDGFDTGSNVFSVGSSSSVTITVWNTGDMDANTVSVRLFDFDVEIDSGVIPLVPAEGSSTISLTYTAPTNDSFRLLRAVIDPKVGEPSILNNEATRIVQVGSPTGVAEIVVNDLDSPIAFVGTLSAISATASYSLPGVPTNYPVRGGTTELIVDGQSHFGLTDFFGNSQIGFSSPGQTGVYETIFHVTDCSIAASGSATGSLTTVPIPDDVWVQSEDIHFEDPYDTFAQIPTNVSMEIRVLLHGAVNGTQSNVPVVVRDLYIDASSNLVSEILYTDTVDFVGAGGVLITFGYTGTVHGAHVIETIMSPTFGTLSNDKATRVLQVGEADPLLTVTIQQPANEEVLTVDPSAVRITCSG